MMDMIEKLTIADISTAIAFIVSIIGGIGYLKKNLHVWIANALDGQLKNIDKEVKGLSDRMDKVDNESCKNFLVRCLADFEKGDQISEIERERFWEQYEHYQKIGGNSYITRKVEQLKGEGLL